MTAVHTVAGTHTRRVRSGLLLAGVVLIAMNLRPAIAGVGPLVTDIRAATGISSTAFGLLTTLPLLAFAGISALTPFVTRRLGLEGTLAAAMALLAAGTLVRSAPSVGLLFIGTGLLGVGIALGNVLLPALVKRDFAHRAGSMTGLYSGFMGLGATAAAGASVPIADVLGWRTALGIWAVPAVAALLLWLPQLKRAAAGVRPQPGAARTDVPVGRLSRSVLAWQLALFMGIQSLTFYVVLAWLPGLLQSRGLGAAEAGWMLALSQAAGILGTVAVPILAGRAADQRKIVWGLGFLEALSLAGALLPGLTAYAFIWVSTLGFVLGGTFGLSLLLLVVRAADARTAAGLSAMAQAVGYLIAAAGPALFGLLHDLSRGWTIPLALLAAALAAKVVTGLGAARPGEVRQQA